MTHAPEALEVITSAIEEKLRQEGVETAFGDSTFIALRVLDALREAGLEVTATGGGADV